MLVCVPAVETWGVAPSRLAEARWAEAQWFNAASRLNSPQSPPFLSRALHLSMNPRINGSGTIVRVRAQFYARTGGGEV